MGKGAGLAIWVDEGGIFQADSRGSRTLRRSSAVIATQGRPAALFWGCGFRDWLWFVDSEVTSVNTLWWRPGETHKPEQRLSAGMYQRQALSLLPTSIPGAGGKSPRWGACVPSICAWSGGAVRRSKPVSSAEISARAPHQCSAHIPSDSCLPLPRICTANSQRLQCSSGGLLGLLEPTRPDRGKAGGSWEFASPP